MTRCIVRSFVVPLLFLLLATPAGAKTEQPSSIFKLDYAAGASGGGRHPGADTCANCALIAGPGNCQ